MAMNIVMYTPYGINNRVYNSAPELFEHGFATAWVFYPIFLFPVDEQGLIIPYFVEEQEPTGWRNHLPRISRESGRLIEGTSERWVGMFWFPYHVLEKLNFRFRLVESKDKTYVYSGTEIAKAVAADLWKYYCSIKYQI